MNAETLLYPTPDGLYCPGGGFHVDPVRPVPRALITHGHADHARSGHGAVLATRQTLDIMAIRYGADFAGERQVAEGALTIGEARVQFHPAGHVLGSAQIEIETGGTRFVVTGDYCRHRNPVAAPFEPVPCDIFITEATFALPVFRHPDPAAEIAKLLASVAAFPDRAHLVGTYALGKAQRLIMLLREAGWDGPLYLHGALERLCRYHAEQGIPLGDLRSATDDSISKAEFAGQIVLAPPSAFAATWAQRFPDPVIAFASGWMQIRARARQRGVELPLVISDHADWPDLLRTIEEVDPQETWITHGREEALIRQLDLMQRRGRPLHLIGFEEEPEA